jgi:hypothetical protein
VSERLNRTIMEKVRAMLDDSGLPKFLWAEAVSHAVYLKNRTWTRNIGNTTPYEILYGHKPNISNLHPWGCKVRVTLKVDSKLEGRSFVGRWMGFDEQTKDGHRVYWPEKRKVSVERNVKFNFETEEVIVGDLPLEGEQSIDERSSVVRPETTDQINHPGTIESELRHISTENLPIRQANPTVDPEPFEGRGKRIRKETEYVRLLREGSGVTGGRGSVLPRGMQQGTVVGDTEAIQTAITREDGAEVEHAMATMIESAQGLTPTYVEAKRRPDWPKWEEAIQ